MKKQKNKKTKKQQFPHTVGGCKLFGNPELTCVHKVRICEDMCLISLRTESIWYCFPVNVSKMFEETKEVIGERQTTHLHK
jgi:hypothetical protein